MMRVLSRRDVQRAVTMAEAIDTVQAAYVQLSEGTARVPIRLPVEVPEQDGVVLYMPAYLSPSGGLGAKVVSVFPHNPERGLATIHALVIVNDGVTGAPLAVIEAGYLTALRTGAAAGVATRLLARPEAKVAAIVGAGVQGRAQLEGVCAVRDLELAWVYDTNRAAAQRLAAEMAARGGRVPEVRVAPSAQAAVREAGIICTATTSRQPVFADADLAPGAHINGIGSFTPEMQEVPAETVRRARVVVDSVAACLAEAGDLIIPLQQGLIGREHITTEIGQVAAGTQPGRTSAHQVTFFKSVGNAVQDVAVAQLVLTRAAALGLGVEVEL
jgi:ornithine cyclodeaminase/alanine dehydrogenase-like protein (mu-crystallin family)